MGYEKRAHVGKGDAFLSEPGLFAFILRNKAWGLEYGSTCSHLAEPLCDPWNTREAELHGAAAQQHAGQQQPFQSQRTYPCS